MGMGVFGSIRWSNDHFIGDTPTTTDILGPFYRPGAQARTNLNPPGFTSEVLHFSGTIFREDGKTPMRNCFIEIWQCQPDGLFLPIGNAKLQFRFERRRKFNLEGTKLINYNR